MKPVRRIFIFPFFAFLLCALPIRAENPYSVETKPPRGFMPTADQLTSPVDSIDPVSGKLHLSIPLASLPHGRANSGFDLNLEYDSHMYDIEPEALVNVPPEYLWMPPQTGYRLSSQWATGGWHYNFENLKLEVEEQSGAMNDGPCPDDVPRLVYRVRVGLLDGSLHTMILKGWEPGGSYLGALQQGFAGLHPLTGTANHCAPMAGYPYQYNGWLSYYSIDGSYLKLETYVNGSNPLNTLFYIYFPDGRRMSGHGFTVDTLYDANGNAVHLSAGCYDGPCNRLFRAISDDIGHEVRINFNVENLPYGGVYDGRTDTVVSQGPNGPMTTTVNWERILIGADNRTYSWSDAPWDPSRPLYNIMHVVKYVQLPLAAAVASNQVPPVWNSYAFGYSDDTDLGYGEVDSVRTPSGSQFQFRYNWDGFGSSLSSLVIANFNAVRERKISHDGVTDLFWTYSYNWDKTTITNPDGSQALYWHGPQGNYLDSSIGENLGVGDVVYRIDEANGRVQKRLWSQNRTPLLYISGMPGIQNPWVRRETATIGNAAGAPSLTAVTERMIDKNGNLLQTTEYDWVSYNPFGPETGSGPQRITQFTYHAGVPDAVTNTYSPYEYWNPHFYPLTSGSARRLNAVRRKEVSDGYGNKAAVAEFVYDDPFRAGNVTSELRWDSVKSASVPALGTLSVSNSQVLTRSYDGYGNITDFYEPEIRTHIAYDGTGSVPTRVDYAYGSSQQRSWEYSWNLSAGTLNSKRDIDNNLTTSYTYDAVGRQLAASEAGLRISETVYDDANLRVTVKKDLNALGDGKLQASTQYDQLGRPILTRSSEPDNADGIKVKSMYYPQLNRSVHSSPYRTTADATLEWTCTQSDASRRVVAIATFRGSEPADCTSTLNRSGITSTVYDANQTTVTDPASKQIRQIVDGLGRLTQVIEDPNGLNYSTTYAYNVLGNLTQVNQGVQTRTFGYSSLGRLKSAVNPESGTINYIYLDSGDLASRTDARGVVAAITYDAMHRVLTKSYSGDGGVTPNVTYSYYGSGSSVPNIGQLQSMTSSSATVIYGNYDAMGRLVSNTQLTNGSAYSFLFTYRLNDSLSSIQYPSGKTVNLAADDAGRVNKISTVGKTYTDLTASGAPFAADGRIAQMKLGNDLWETRDYRTPGTPTLLKLGTTVGASDKLELEYDYSADAYNGNLERQVIRQPGHTWTQNYTYDSLNRLATAIETNGFSRTYGYDRYGNRWVPYSTGITWADAHEPAFGTLFNAVNNRLANQSYDAAGNQTSYDPRTLAYDAENRLISASSSVNGNESFVYDGDGRRVRKTWTPNGGSTQITTYVYGPNGQVAAEYSNQTSSTTGTSWMFTDMLGSVRAVTGDKPQSGSATITECYDYLPFGRMLSSSDNGRNTGCYPSSPDFLLPSVESPKFTGKSRDVETGLDYFGARYMSAALGRFTSPDKLFADQRQADPQSWNMYAYVGNNPMKFVDANGKWKTGLHEDVIDGAFERLEGSQRGVMKASSERVDGFLNGGQKSENAYKHGMRGNFQTAEKARQLADEFISAHEANAGNIAKSDDGVSDAALDEFGAALHTVTDRLSPAHAGEQLWTGAGEPGVTTAIGGIGGLIGGAVTDGARAEIHNRKEKTMSLGQFHDAIDAARSEYLKTFGQDAFVQATGCKQVSGCKYNDSILRDENKTK